DRVIPQFIKLARQNRNLIVYGMQKFLDFTYIDDSISGLFKCINNFDRIKNDVFNIASGKGVRIIEIAELIKSHIGSNSRILIKENRAGEIEHYVANISKAKKILGYKPKTKITEGIRKTVDWYGKSMR
ncbi:MAG: GDP-mannose 4,6-dehydratase, partial [Candidatus Bathyarchaeia archaeon]